MVNILGEIEIEHELDIILKFPIKKFVNDGENDDTIRFYL